jgi:enoyl reductase-like protein
VIYIDQKYWLYQAKPLELNLEQTTLKRKDHYISEALKSLQSKVFISVKDLTVPQVTQRRLKLGKQHKDADTEIDPTLDDNVSALEISGPHLIIWFCL